MPHKAHFIGLFNVVYVSSINDSKFSSSANPLVNASILSFDFSSLRWKEHNLPLLLKKYCFSCFKTQNISDVEQMG